MTKRPEWKELYPWDCWYCGEPSTVLVFGPLEGFGPEFDHNRAWVAACDLHGSLAASIPSGGGA